MEKQYRETGLEFTPVSNGHFRQELDQIFPVELVHLTARESGNLRGDPFVLIPFVKVAARRSFGFAHADHHPPTLARLARKTDKVWPSARSLRGDSPVTYPRSAL